MRISQKLGYALHAMLELALHDNRQEFVRTADIARGQRIPEKFLEAIVVELRRAGLIVSQRGPVGGHRLARDPVRISIGDIWRAIDDPHTDSPAGKSEDVFGKVWKDVDHAVAGVVDSVTLADIRQSCMTRANAPDFNI